MAKKKKDKKKGSPVAIILLLVIAIVAIVVMQQSALFVMFALLPSVAAYPVDRSPNKEKFKAITAMNLAGIWPYVAELGQQGFTQEATYMMMSDVYAWAVVYGAAALGYALVWISPLFTLSLMELMARMKLHHLEHRQEKLVREWGDRIKEE